MEVNVTVHFVLVGSDLKGQQELECLLHVHPYAGVVVMHPDGWEVTIQTLRVQRLIDRCVFTGAATAVNGPRKSVLEIVDFTMFITCIRHLLVDSATAVATKHRL